MKEILEVLCINQQLLLCQVVAREVLVEASKANRRAKQLLLLVSLDCLLYSGLFLLYHCHLSIVVLVYSVTLELRLVDACLNEGFELLVDFFFRWYTLASLL